MANLSNPDREVSRFSIRGIVNSLTKPTPQVSATEAWDKAHPPAPAATPAAPTAAPATPAISSYAGNTALARREKEAGLKDGGQLVTGKGGAVRGKGQGDKIPAKYEPGEFVVSNAMLDSAPGLREMLSNLREKTLASQGKTVAQADAGAIDQQGVKAKDGYSDERDKLISQIPGSAPDGWAGGTGEKVSGNDFTRGVGNTLNAVAPLSAGAAMPIAAGAVQKVAGPVMGALKSSAMANTVGYGVPVAAGAALMTAANQPSVPAMPSAAPTAPMTKTDVQRGGGSTAPAPTQIAASDAALPPAAPTGVPAVAAPAQTEGQRVMDMNNQLADSMKADRLATEQAARGAPQTTVLHSGNDWASRKALANLETGASSITNKTGGRNGASPAVTAYLAAQAHDQSLQGGGTTADIANVAAANRHDEIKSIAQVANARTAQQGQQFGASQDIAKQRLALDNRRADITDAGAQMDNATKKQLQDLNAQILKETDPAKLAVLQEKAQTLTGKYQRTDPANRDVYGAIAGGTDAMGNKTDPIIYNKQTGERAGAQGPVATPKVDEVRGGYKFKGGNPADQKNWEKV